MSTDHTPDPYEVSAALRRAGVTPLDRPAQWTAVTMLGWPDRARQAAQEVLADPVRLLASQLFALDDSLISEGLADLASFVAEPTDAQAEADHWVSDRRSVLAAVGAILCEAARQEAALDDAQLPDTGVGRDPDVAEWIPFMARPAAQTEHDVLPLFLSTGSPL